MAWGLPVRRPARPNRPSRPRPPRRFPTPQNRGVRPRLRRKRKRPEPNPWCRRLPGRCRPRPCRRGGDTRDSTSVRGLPLLNRPLAPRLRKRRLRRRRRRPPRPTFRTRPSPVLRPPPRQSRPSRLLPPPRGLQRPNPRPRRSPGRPPSRLRCRLRPWKSPRKSLRSCPTTPKAPPPGKRPSTTGPCRWLSTAVPPTPGLRSSSL